MLNASDIMSTEVIAVRPDTGIKELAAILYKHHINGVPVVDEDEKLLGVVCESDLIRLNKKLHIPTVVALFDWVLYLENPRKMEKEIERINAATVKDLYTTEVITVDEKTPVDEIASIMTEKRVYTIPVMDGDRVVGIIGKADLIRTLVP
ncbi:MAG: CBS domain-containing protein [Deltaproteobacteria bacterium]|nr:CBS domain-containing protein [Deltaproteobacteria bacterium]MBW1923192.1 CBS domain-containing protein [Deltaproteobacteria bacterium]MBW1948277.1 CBS domain-containing protein [Deltaproteobacteria bacterium]MBW2006774.1 CBS domain-containing protein [Deltaproteobacteria bacterium]MBW2101514.1 CBS domain-containing protein [Deltaproteobacteria bacterium]